MSLLTSAVSRSAVATGAAQPRQANRPSHAALLVPVEPCSSSRAASVASLRRTPGGSLVSRRRIALVRSSSAPQENEPETNSTPAETTESSSSVGQIIGNFGFIGVFLGSVVYAGIASFQKIQTDPENVGVLAGPPLVFAAVFASFAFYKAFSKVTKGK